MKKFRVLALSLVLAAVPFLVQPQTASASPTPNERLFGSNRLETANAVADKGWPNGVDTAILVREDDFPDALAGAPLAHKDNAPILLTDRYTLSPETAQEISKLHVKKVIILGSSYAVSSDIQNTLSALLGTTNVERIGGTDRFDTAARIAQAVGGTSGQAVIAYGLNFPDALAVSPWAAKNGVPILLTETNTLPAYTSKALTTLGINKTAVVGSNVVISDAVFDGLKASNFNPTRYSGPNRFATALDINTRIGTDNGTQLNPNNVFLATGLDFPDALAGSALAAQNGNPIVLTDSDLSDYEIMAYIDLNYAKINKLTVLGSKAVVPDNVVTVIAADVQDGKFTDSLSSKYNNYPIGGTTIPWTASLVWSWFDTTTMDPYIYVTTDSSAWTTAKANDISGLENYVKNIVTSAETEYPGHNVKLWFDDELGNTRAYAYTSNGSIIVQFDPAPSSAYSVQSVDTSIHSQLKAKLSALQK